MNTTTKLLSSIRWADVEFLETEVDTLTLSLTLGLFILAVLAFFGFKEYPHLKEVLAKFSLHRVAERHLTASSRQGDPPFRRH
jgi:hypothetical protein